MLNKIKEVVEDGFVDKSILVIGDLMLDKYLMGKVGRISPEAPVPILNLENERNVPGGAGNLTLNLNGLGISVFLISMIGNDTEGDLLKNILEEAGIDSSYLILADEKPTITKTRIVGENQQLVRIDKEEAWDISESLQKHVKKKIQSVFETEKIDALIISDYAKGLITDELSTFVIKKAQEYGIPVLVDPKGRDFNKYQNATIITPNEKELSLVCNHRFVNDNELKKCAIDLYKRLNIDYLVVTRGEKGITLITDEYEYDVPTRARDVYDVSGAGDTVIALIAAGVVSDLSIEEALELANLGAGYVISKFGTNPIIYSELLSVIHQHLITDQKLFDKDELKIRINYWKENNQKIVFTNGCFDILHCGHIHLLKNAKREGDKLIVAINTDSSVKKLKGESRPVNKLEDRVQVLEAISFVDAVVPFDELTPLELIKYILPDVLVKGADYEEDDIVGAEEVKENGGEVVRIPLIEGKSTTNIIQQVSGSG